MVPDGSQNPPRGGCLSHSGQLFSLSAKIDRPRYNSINDSRTSEPKPQTLSTALRKKESTRNKIRFCLPGFYFLKMHLARHVLRVACMDRVDMQGSISSSRAARKHQPPPPHFITVKRNDRPPRMICRSPYRGHVVCANTVDLHRPWLLS